MGLIDLQTNLKSLRYGKDRVYGGDSGQPYIQKDIPEQVGEFGFLNQDFILRGGSKAVTDSALDVERLGKYFLDIRNPSGLLFVAKQNLLSRTAVRTQASTGLLNEGIYTPLSTLIEAGGVAFGLHVNKQGLNPFASTGPTSTNDNLYGVRIRNYNIEALNFPNSILKNRLTALYNVKIINKDIGDITKVNNITDKDDYVNLITYPGGPDSNLGIGKTNIKFATSGNGTNNVRTGYTNYFRANPNLRNYFIGFSYSPQTEYLTKFGLYEPIPLGDPEANLNRFLGLSLIKTKYFSLRKNKIYDSSLNSVISPTVENDTTNLLNPNNNNTITYTQDDLQVIPEESKNNGESFYVGGSGVTTPGDFRVLLRKNPTDSRIGNVVTVSPRYEGENAKNIEQRVNLGDPGNRSGKNLTFYVNGNGTGKTKGAASITGNGSYDKITSQPLYQSNKPDFSKRPTNDLVKFAIGVMNLPSDSGGSVQKTYIHFRAFLNQITDNYVADWQSTQYIGRGEKFYNYTGFDRKFSLSWTVAAQSKAELIPMYKKLNYLASVCAPDYSEAGYMRGNIVTLTVGGYFYDQPGIITGFNYEMNDDQATWEIGIPDDSNQDPFYDSSVKELPHLIKVTGFQFIPIHTFVPRKQSLNINDIENSDSSDPNIALYGKERYIHLSNGMPNSWNRNNSNYGDIYSPSSTANNSPIQKNPQIGPTGPMGATGAMGAGTPGGVEGVVGPTNQDRIIVNSNR